MIYLISVCGYEEYNPVYFRCNCSKEEFESEVSKAMSEAVEQLKDSYSFISGHCIQDKMVPILSKKFEHIQMDHEVLLYGECLYSEGHEKPQTITDEAWDKILKHNEKIHNELYKDLKEKEQ